MDVKMWEIIFIQWAIFLDVREFFLHQREDAMPIPSSQLKYTAPFLSLAQVPVMGVLLEQFGERLPFHHDKRLWGKCGQR
jgi:hypothetical protein